MKEDTHTEKVTLKNDYISCKLILVFFSYRRASTTTSRWWSSSWSTGPTLTGGITKVGPRSTPPRPVASSASPSKFAFLEACQKLRHEHFEIFLHPPSHSLSFFKRAYIHVVSCIIPHPTL